MTSANKTMTLLRRSAFFQLSLSENPLPDLAAVLTTGGSTETSCQWIAYSALVGRPLLVSEELVDALKYIPSHRWIEIDELLETADISLMTLEHLADIGLVITDSNEKTRQKHFETETALEATAWHPLAAIYHFCTKWNDFHLEFNIPNDATQIDHSRERKETIFSDFIKLHGFPPTHFYTRQDAIKRHNLPQVYIPGGTLFDALVKRRTRRIFDLSAAIPLESFSAIMRSAFGPQGIYKVYENTYGLGKTSPSGGGLHPTEVYALVSKVEGFDPGLYHYNQEFHSLDAIRYLSEDTARDTANTFTASQQYPTTAGVLFIMTSRFYRNYWKYRQHPRAYPVLYMDIAHLSQTFYLLCETFQLGAFFTAAINAGNIERELNLDGYREGALAILGCGIPAANQLGLEVDFSPFKPEEKRL